MNILSILDRFHFMRFKIWDFSFRSLRQKYGHEFIRKVVLRHPVRTARGIIQYQKSKTQNTRQNDFYSTHPSEKITLGSKTIIGVGYCMKPSGPACISGRGNHDCWYFENHSAREPEPLPECCRICPILRIGLQSLSAGCNFYIMTSAKEILNDLYVPSLEHKTFTNGIFVLCRYSFEPFAVACSIAGIHSHLIPFERNDCADYASWLYADDGFKEEQTELHKTSYESITDMLQQCGENRSAKTAYKKMGNIFYNQ